jgi:hypothetical protein
MARKQSRPKTVKPVLNSSAATVGGGHGAAPSTGPCKLTPVTGQGNAFRCNASDMPIDFLLSTPDGKTEFLSVEAREDSDLGKTVPGQPTALSASAFTLDLKVGSYVVIIVVGSLPSAKPVWIVESCLRATKLDWIAVPVNTTGEFALAVM